MSTRNIIRAWKDAAFRNTLTESERAALPGNPAGLVEVSDEDLGKIAGGRPPLSEWCPTFTGCTCFQGCTYAGGCE